MDNGNYFRVIFFVRFKMKKKLSLIFILVLVAMVNAVAGEVLSKDFLKGQWKCFEGTSDVLSVVFNADGTFVFGDNDLSKPKKITADSIDGKGYDNKFNVWWTSGTFSLSGSKLNFFVTSGNSFDKAIMTKDGSAFTIEKISSDKIRISDSKRSLIFTKIESDLNSKLVGKWVDNKNIAWNFYPYDVMSRSCKDWQYEAFYKIEGDRITNFITYVAKRYDSIAINLMSVENFTVKSISENDATIVYNGSEFYLRKTGSYNQLGVGNLDMVQVKGKGGIKDLLVCKTEVTNKIYSDVMGIGACNDEMKDFPKDNISWFDAIAFCNELSRLHGLTPVYKIDYDLFGFTNYSDVVSADENANGYRLLTRDEWYYVARGGDKSRGYRYSGSNYIDDVAWYCENNGGMYKNVATKAPNELGIYDMTGSVYEWVYDTCNEIANYIMGGGFSSREDQFCSLESLTSCSNAYGTDRFASCVGFRICRNAR